MKTTVVLIVAAIIAGAFDVACGGGAEPEPVGHHSQTLESVDAAATVTVSISCAEPDGRAEPCFGDGG